MPFYEIHHICQLTASQKEELAGAITDIHSTLFTTPRLFVNVSYTDASSQDLFVAGSKKPGNHIKGHVRNGPGRKRSDWQQLCDRVTQEWDKIVGSGLPKIRRGDADQDTSLRSCILMGDLLFGTELGMTFPEAGGDAQWLEENWAEFSKRADNGDEEMRDMLKECKERGLVGETNGMTAQQRLEEALGWGESA